MEEAHTLVNASKSDEVQHLNSKIIERDEQIKQLDLEFNHSKYNLEKSEAQNEDLQIKVEQMKKTLTNEINKLNDLQKEKIEASVVLGEHQAKLRTIEVKHQELLQANHKQDRQT